MKVNIINHYEVFDNKINNFIPTIIDDDEYNLFRSLSQSGYLTTDRWVLYAYQKKYKDNTINYLLAISTYVEIISCQQNLHTTERFYNLQLFNGKENITISVDSGILTSSGIKKLLQYGCIFDENNQKYLLSYLSTSACNAEIEYVHSVIGWNFRDEPIFLNSKCISKSGFQSKYIGRFDLKPKGSIENTKTMIQKEVLGNSILELSLILGCSAPILGYLNNYYDLGCLVFSYGSNSSRGKTTAGLLIASIYGCPNFGKALMTTMNGTENSLLTFASSADSHPIIFDELATLPTHNLRKLLYQFASGKEKSRNDKEGNIKKTKTFNNIVITTSEFPIIDNSVPDGLRTRIFQISSEITKSAKNADSIKQCVYANYGHIGTKFVNFLVSYKLDNIKNDYEKSYKDLVDIYKKNEIIINHLTIRILSKFAVIFLAGKYFNECFEEIKIDLKSLVKTLIHLERNVADEINIEEKALECILQYVSTHKSHFIVGCNEWLSSIEGKVRSSTNGKEIIILKSIVEKILKENNYENPKLIYQKWSDKKILIREKDRPYKRLKLTSDLPKQPCFVFRIVE